MQLPGDFLVTLTNKETKEILISRLRLFVGQHFEKQNAFSLNTFYAEFHHLVIVPRYRKVMQEVLDQLFKDGVIEDMPGNPTWFRFRKQTAL